jgi:hypothetical protein
MTKSPPHCPFKYLVHSLRVIEYRKLYIHWLFHLQKLTQRTPPLLHIEEQQLLLWHHPVDIFYMPIPRPPGVSSLSRVVVQLRPPPKSEAVDKRHKASNRRHKREQVSPKGGEHIACHCLKADPPLVWISNRAYDLGVRIAVHQFLNEHLAGRVRRGDEAIEALLQALQYERFVFRALDRCAG